MADPTAEGTAAATAAVVETTATPSTTVIEVVATTVDPNAPAPTERDEQGRFRNPIQPRIDELTRKNRESEREAAFWKQRATAQAPAAEVVAPKKPEPKDYADYGEYVEALTDFKAQEKVEKALDARDAKSTAAQAATKAATSWDERQTAARAAIPDYDKVMAASETPIAKHVGELLLDPEVDGPTIAHHLALHPEVADKLNRMTPIAAAREMGRIEASLTKVADPTATATPNPADEPKVIVTKAPAPLKTLAPAASTTLDLSKLSMDDYVKTRKAQGASWAR